MKQFRLSRRALLRGAGGALVALPALEAMWAPKAGAQATTAPRRFVAVYSPNGTNSGSLAGPGIGMEPFMPATTGTDFVLGNEVAPLEALRKKLLIVRQVHGFSMEDDVPDFGDLHSIGIAQMLTGVRTQYDPTTGGKIPGANGQSYGMGISLDQYLAQKIGGATRFPSLEFGVITTTDGGVLPFSRMIYSGPNQPVPPVEDPAVMYARMFSDGTPIGEMTADQTIAQRKSVLDFVMDDASKLGARLGQSDRQKLEAHFDLVRDLEGRLNPAQSGGPTASCDQTSGIGSPGDPQDKANFQATGKLMMDLLALALKCDITRVASLQWSWARSNLVYSWLGASEGHHDMTHSNNGGASPPLAAINTWYASQLLYLGQQLDAVTDVDGSNLLDNTVIYWCSDVSWAYVHGFDNLRAFFLGSCGGFLKQGEVVDVGDKPHQRLLVTLLNAMGVNENSFGDATYGTGPFAEMIA